jgi:hypothetical protein
MALIGFDVRNNAARWSTCMIAVALAAASVTSGCQSKKPEPDTSATPASASAAVAPASASAAASASASAATPAKPPPVVEEPKTELQRLARDAIDAKVFEKDMEAEAWAFYPPGTTGCPILGDAQQLTKPSDPAREFDREKVVAKFADKLVVMVTESAKEKPSDESFAKISTYNHAAGTFKIQLQDTGSTWPILGGSPKIGEDREMSDVRDVFVANRSGGYVITAPRRVPFYSIMDKETFTVKVEPEEAKRWTVDGVDLRFLVVQRFKRLGFHKNCMRVCKRIDRETVDCPDDPENQGFGMYFVTEPVGYEVYANGKLVAEKQPSP